MVGKIDSVNTYVIYKMNSVSLFWGGRLLKSICRMVNKLNPMNDILKTIKLLMKMSTRRPKCEIVHIFIYYKTLKRKLTI